MELGVAGAGAGSAKIEKFRPRPDKMGGSDNTAHIDCVAFMQKVSSDIVSFGHNRCKLKYLIL